MPAINLQHPAPVPTRTTALRVVVAGGGVAAQQADAAAEAIAAEAGAALDPRPYRPVLRGLLLTGDTPLYLRNDLTGDGIVARPLRHTPPQTSRSPLWWPSEKIVRRYITGYLARAGAAGAAAVTGAAAIG